MRKNHVSTLARWGLVGSLIAVSGFARLPERESLGFATEVVTRPVPTTTEHVSSSHDSSSHDAAVHSFLNTPSSGTVPLEEATGEVKEFTLEIHKITAELAPDVAVEQWAFALPGEAPSVPGPELRVTEGDLVRVTMKNTHDQPHSLHLHGITSLAQGMDGVPHTSHQVLPGEAYTYEFVATEPGTHAYHCHVQTYLHMDMGMYGALIVEPREERVADRDYTLILDEWDSEQDPLAAVHAPENNYFLINGKAFPSVEPLEIPEGEVARVRMINMGYEPHAMHLHGMNFLVVAKDGYDLPQPYRADTLPIFPGERYDLLVKGRDGDFPFHDHIVKSVTNGGVYPGGMHTMVVGSEARIANPDAVVTKLASVTPAPVATPSGHLNHTGHDHAAHAPTPTTPTEAGAVLDGEVTVRVTQFAFDTPVLRVKKGTTVTWINDDVAPHTVTEGTPGADPATRAFDSSEEAKGTPKMMNQGDTWTTTFDEVGEYDYYCLPHPFMTAKVIVE
jgi:manganese oxidase